MSNIRLTPPLADEMFLSRPPYLLMARVRAVEETDCQPQVVYDLLDDSGDPLCESVREPLDASWWANFQPLVRRYG